MASISAVHGATALDELLRAFRGQTQSRADVLTTTSDVLLTFGYERMRYYELAENQIPGISATTRLYLAFEAHAERGPIADRIGYSIPWDLASINDQPVHAEGAIRTDLSPIVQSDHANEQGSVERRWVDELGLTGKSWIDAPVYAGQDLVGVLCLDWTGPSSDFNSETRTIIGLAGSILGEQLMATKPPILEGIQESLLNLHSTSTHRHELIVEAVTSFAETVGVASASVFEFDWTRQVLTRTVLELDGHRGTGDFSKETVRVGENLTGLAWEHPEDYRFVVQFSELHQQRPELVSQVSLDAHEAALGTVQSVMYGRVGDEAPVYLIRLINKSTYPGLPFLQERPLFESFVSFLAPIVDSRVASERGEALATVLDALAKEVPSAQVCRIAFASLRELENVDRAAIVAHRVDGYAPYFVTGVHPSAFSRARGAILTDPLYKRLIASGASLLITKLGKGAFSTVVRQSFEGVSRIASSSFSAGGTRGLLIIPLYPASGRVLSEPNAGSRAFIAQMAQAIGQRLDAELIKTVSEGALQSLSLIGHEMVTPLAKASSLTEKTIEAARMATAPYIKEPGAPQPSYFSDLQAQIRHEYDNVRAAVSLGALVGKVHSLGEGTGRANSITGMRQEVSARSLVNAAIARVRADIARDRVLPPPAGFVFWSPTGEPAATVHCDRSLLESALMNLFRNAVKYSIAEDAPGVISTHVEASTIRDHPFVIFRVRNQGAHIAELDRASMFDAFVRLDTKEPRVRALDRRGMGLGLYLARVIARSHEGDLEMTSHRPATRSRVNRDVTGVYDTEFSLRVRADLPLGSYRYDEAREWA